jgi:hypothetical protein
MKYSKESEDKQTLLDIRMMLLILQLKQADFKNKMKQHFSQANATLR